MSKLFCFRFDVDTHRCIRDGMPALSALAGKLDVPFTFFVNMGRAVSRSAVLGQLISESVPSSAPDAAKYSARTKLGWRGYLEAAILNPKVGGSAHEVIRQAHGAGHEIGLHGGRNHAVWQHEAGDWDQARLEAEVDAVLPALALLLGDDGPFGFASPGWTTSALLPSVLAERGFRYVADLHGPEPDTTPELARAPSPVEVVRPQLTGEPGGVAYVEHLRASGLDDVAMLRRFEADLYRAGPTVVVYDHPYYAGVRELPMVERMVAIARGAGYEVVPLSAIAEAQAT